MRISVTGINHHTTPVSLRERYAFAADDLVPALQRLIPDFEAAAILSTCNRTELYLATEDDIDSETAVAALSRARAAASPEGVVFYHHTGHERRAASLRRRRRHRFARRRRERDPRPGARGVLGLHRSRYDNPVLARLFHTAMRAARRARSETEIGAHGMSVSAMAVNLSRNALGSLRRKTVLVVGTGEAGRKAAAALAQAGAGRLLVTTRTAGRADEIAAELGGIALPFSELPSALIESDVVISATAAPDAVISTEAVRNALAAREGRPIVMVDIAVPRDIEPSVRTLPGIHLFDIDDLEALAARNLDARRGEVTSVETIIAAEVERFAVWLESVSVEPTIVELRRRAEATRQAELERTLARLPHLDEADRRRIEAMSKALTNQLLHTPVQRLRETGNDRHVEAVRDLFDLDEPPA